MVPAPTTPTIRAPRRQSDRLEVLERLAARRGSSRSRGIGSGRTGFLDDVRREPQCGQGTPPSRSRIGPAARCRRAASAAHGPAGVIRSEVQGTRETSRRPSTGPAECAAGDPRRRRGSGRAPGSRQTWAGAPRRIPPSADLDRVRPSRGPSSTPSGAPGRGRPPRAARTAAASTASARTPARRPRPARLARDRGVHRGLAHHVAPGSAAPDHGELRPEPAERRRRGRVRPRAGSRAGGGIGRSSAARVGAIAAASAPRARPSAPPGSRRRPAPPRRGVARTPSRRPVPASSSAATSRARLAAAPGQPIEPDPTCIRW